MYRSSLQPKFSKNFYQAEFFKTEDHADEIKSINLKIFNPLDEASSSSTFFAGENYRLCREECRTLVKGLKEFLHDNAAHVKPPLSKLKIDQLDQQLTSLECHLCDATTDYFANQKETIYGEGKTKLAEFMILLKRENIPLDKRMNALINAAPTMELCSGGLMTALHEAVSSLKYSTVGIRGAAARIKAQMLDHLISEHIKKERHPCKPNEEIHLINYYFNKVAKNFGTAPRKDYFTGIFDKKVSADLTTKCADNISRELRPDSLSTAIALNYLDQIIGDQNFDLTKPIQDINIKKIINQITKSARNLEPEYGSTPLISSFLRGTDGEFKSYDFIKQPALISKHFIEKLKESQLVDSYEEINLTEDEVNGFIKQIGNIFWRQLNTNDCEEVKPEELIAIPPFKIQESLEKQNISVGDQACIFIEIAQNAYDNHHPNFSFNNPGAWFATLSGLLQLSGQTDCRPALHLAAAVGSKEGIKHLISIGGDVNARDAGSNTPLMVATQNNRLDIIQELINQQCDPYLQNNIGNTALMIAAGNPIGAASVKLLSAYSKSEEATNHRGENVFTRAASDGSLESVRILLGIAPTVDTTKPHKEQAEGINTPLNEYLLTRTVNQPDGAHQSMLHSAAKNGRVEIVELLIWAGANPNIADRENVTPLMRAVINNKLNVILPLIKAGSMLTNEIPFLFSRDNSEALKTLHEAGAYIHETNHKGVTILMLSAEHGKVQFLQYLLQDAEPAYINASRMRGNEICTALSLATEVKDMKATSLLLKAGAESGQLVINVAAQGVTQNLEHLIAAGADITARDPSGMTALMLAAQNGRLENIKRLCEVLKPDEINAKFNDPQAPNDITALSFASKANHTDVVEWLISKGAIDTRQSTQTPKPGLVA